MDQKNQYKNKFDNFIRYSSLGFEMMAIIGAGTFGGYKIDQWMDNEFKGFTFGLMVISVVFAIVYGTKSLLKRGNSRKPEVGRQKMEDRSKKLED
jgi:uncharacterized membrane protein YfcA